MTLDFSITLPAQKNHAETKLFAVLDHPSFLDHPSCSPFGPSRRSPIISRSPFSTKAEITIVTCLDNFLKILDHPSIQRRKLKVVAGLFKDFTFLDHPSAQRRKLKNRWLFADALQTHSITGNNGTGEFLVIIWGGRVTL